ncbi:MAG: hypothetical protein R3E79_00280 [Caldilineaceae bacterium]
MLYWWNANDLIDQPFLANASIPSADSIPAAVLHLCGGLLHLIQALANSALTPNLWLITSQSQAVDGQTNSVMLPAMSVAQTSLWGLARAIRVEHPEFNCRSLDLETLDVEMSASNALGITDFIL